MPTPAEITSFDEDEPPAGESPWVVEPVPVQIHIAEPDPTWRAQFDAVAARIRGVIGTRVLQLEHVGSTAVPGLPAKPIIDIDLVVADPGREEDWLSPLEDAGFVLTVREPWWHGHRMMRGTDPAVNLHVFGPESPETWKHRIFRDHLRAHAADRELYAEAKRDSAGPTSDAQTVMEYNRRKEAVLREIYGRAFAAAGFAD